MRLDATRVAKVDGCPPILECDLPAELGARRLALVFGHPQAAVLRSNVRLHDLAHRPAPVAVARVKGDVRAREDPIGQEAQFERGEVVLDGAVGYE